MEGFGGNLIRGAARASVWIHEVASAVWRHRVGGP